MAEERPILEVRNLKKYFKTPKGMLHAVDDVSFSIQRGKTLGVVGESGCGKSTTGRAILRLLEPTAGEVLFEGRDILGLSKDEMRKMRQKMQIIFQDPYSSLNPRMTISDIIAEPLRLHKLCSGSADCEGQVERIMETVGLAERLVNSYPHELDGGRRQRVGIARALVLQPSFIVCDEPVSALDVSIQAQILNLMQDLQEQMHLTYIFITHNLSVVNHLADEIAVMYLGQVVEKAPAVELFEHPQHPYTKALLAAIPVPSLKRRTEVQPLTGEISSPIDPPQSCRFAPRCPYACGRCAEGVPELRNLGGEHYVACCLCQQ
ncbi:ABC transporter ATP-binding protein [Faecalispora anaeroviscerum]|uniref:ABC transporter ATP-binding protein n=1 Tax=Faecalispora anaeroviscerum TaxID=2991836 RepID=UPI0024B88B9C|nr:ABC transporter ATP-binding protein [Faecalispora anaeroviscerum]